MSVIQRPLIGSVVNLSISESEDSAERGFPAWQVNRVTLQVVAALFGQGVSVIFGHDWREDGVMEAVHGFARQMQSPVPISPNEAESIGQPLLRNLLPWPGEPSLPQEDLERLASTLRVEKAGLPQELTPYDRRARHEGAESSLYRYVRARGLTNLRHRLGEAAHARLCLGGRTSGAAGRYPGVIEEAFLALRTSKPLYLAGILGGATRQVIDAIEGRPMLENFCAPTTLNELYLAPPVPERDPGTEPDRLVDRVAIWDTFTRGGRTRLADANALSPDENEELFTTPVLDRVIQLVLTGIARLQARR
jgi:SLOG-like protein